EQKYANLDKTKEGDITDMTYADLSIKRLSREVAQELEYEEKDMVSDLSLLWQGAATQSDTINFALYKLANPDADKPDEKSIKKVLTTIASMSTLVGASMGNPILAGSSLIGGNILGIMGQDVKALNYKYTRVNDADMIILIRKVEDLQQKAIDLYYDYMSAKKQLEYANDLVKERQTKFELAQKNNAARELIVITDAYYRSSLDRQRTAKSEFFSKRAALEQFVGNETFLQFESELLARENGEPIVRSSEEKAISDAENQEYDETIKNVEQYTSILKPEFQVKEEDLEPQAQPVAKTLPEEKKELPTYSYAPVDAKIMPSGSNKVYYDYDYQNDRVPDIRLPEEGGFYSDFTTGFAVELSLDEFFNDQKPAKEKKVKVKKEKAPKVKEEKVKKEKPEKIKEEKVKPEKVKKEKIKKEKVKKAEDEVTSPEEKIEEPKVKEKKIKPKKEKAEKEKPAADDKAASSDKKKKEKKVKDPYPELHGQKPIHKYPRNSTKDLIFLHGHDKQGLKKPSDGGMTFPQPTAKERRAARNKAIDEAVEETTVETKTKVEQPKVATPEPAEKYEVPKNVKVDDFIPLMGPSAKPVQKTVQQVDTSGLPALAPIRVPDLNHGGYSIHSEY
ncbi:hypothetical protein IKR55_05260, partial [bacterium]|nr:hypothetical protein [bacterium]